MQQFDWGYATEYRPVLEGFLVRMIDFGKAKKRGKFQKFLRGLYAEA